MGLEIVRQIEKMVLLTTIDSLWKDHLLAMDHLRDGIGLQGYGQKDPLMAYKKEGFKFFQMMMDQITGDVVRKLFAVQIEGTDREATPPFIPSPFAQAPDPQAIQYNIAPDGSLIAANPGILGSEPMGQQPPAGAYPGQGQSGHQRTAAEFDLANFAKQPKKMTLSHAELGLGGQVVNPGNQAAPGGFDKAGRNDPCPCGSGKKFKKCHGT
jgi:preprotein translocase subunit SecA